MKKLWLALLFFLLTPCLVRAADQYTVANGGSQAIDEFSVCRIVANAHASGKDIMVSTHSSAEWASGANAFANATHPAGITATPCSGASALRLRSGGSAYLNRTFGTLGSRNYWTFSTWVKRGKLGAEQPIFTSFNVNNTNYDRLEFTAADTLRYHMVSSSTTYIDLSTAAVFRDPDAWYHITVTLNGAAASGSRWQVYVNGVKQAFTGTDNATASLIGYTCAHYLGRDQQSGLYFDGYMADTYFVDNANLAPASFAQANADGEWVPKPYTGAFGATGFHLDYSDVALTSGSNAGLGKDMSGNGNYWNTNNISITAGAAYDPGNDAPMSGGNYMTLNPAYGAGAGYATYADGNLRITAPASDQRIAFGSFYVSSGKWYYEATTTSGTPGTADAHYVGFRALTGSVVAYASTAKAYINSVLAGYGATYGLNDVIGIALDLDGNAVEFFKNGVSQGSRSIAAGSYVPYVSIFETGTPGWTLNFGQRAFVHTPPSGYKVLNTGNLPAPAIKTPSDYFKTVSYTGNGSYMSVGEPVKVSGPLNIANSLRFRAGSNAYLNRTPGSGTNRRTWTFSAWIKVSDVTSGDDYTILGVNTDPNNGFNFRYRHPQIEVYNIIGTVTAYDLVTNANYRDPSGWMHVVLAADTTQATASDRLKLYINGQQVTSFATASYPSQNLDTQVNSTAIHYLGRLGWSSRPFNGYMADVNFVDGQQLTPSSFGQADSSGNWAPKAYGGTYGTNGYHLNFADTSDTSAATLGKDTSGNGNNWTPNNFTVGGNNPFEFKSTGFKVGNNSLFNTNANNYISWNWKKGATPGFDIVTYTGTGSARTVAHNLGAVPSMMFIKRLDAAGNNWAAYHKNANASPANGGMYLDGTIAWTADSAWFNNTMPTSSVFTVNTSAIGNAAGARYVAYLWSDVPGFSKFGSYTGNGSADGPFVYTGFKPAYVMIKRTDAANDWQLFDTSRDTYNPAQRWLLADTVNIEGGTVDYLDILSNGFKLRRNGLDVNTSGGTYVYAAFAESPFKEQASKASLDVLSGLRFNAASSPYLSKTLSASGSLRAWTWSGWVKRGKLGSLQDLFGWLDLSGGNFQNRIYFMPDDTLEFQMFNSILGGYVWRKNTAAKFRDPSAWMHIVAVYDSDNATAEDRARLYVNGTRITAWANNTNPALNQDSYINNALYPLGMGSARPSGTLYFDGYMSDINFVDGQALTAASFGEVNSAGLWVPKAYAGAYGANGFHLEFLNPAAPGTDTSGNANTWTATNFASSDTVADSPTNNYMTLALVPGLSGTLSKGNLSVTGNANSMRSNMPIPATGKWYYEATITSLGTNGGYFYCGTTALYRATGERWTGSAWVSYGAAYTTGDVIACAADLDNNQVTWYKNNVSQGTITSNVGLARNGFSDYWGNDATGIWTVDYNFGQGGQAGLTYNGSAGGSFKYTPPTGFKALSTSNMAASVIPQPSQYFKAAIYTGNASTQTVNVGFQPDLTWIKDRSAASNHVIEDSVRVANGSPYLSSNTTAAETKLFDVTLNDALADVPNAYDAGHGNFATWNPLYKGSALTLSKGNLQVDGSTTASLTNHQSIATIGMSSGKWYWEGIDTNESAQNLYAGITTLAMDPSATACGSANGSDTGYGLRLRGSTGSGSAQIYHLGSAGSYSTASANGDVIMIAYDADQGKLWFGRNGTWGSGDPAAGTSPAYSGITGTQYPCVGHGSGSAQTTSSAWNFGQRNFAYTPPSGFSRLQSYNFANDSFVPDLVMVKNRSSATDWAWYDTTRGATLEMSSNLTAAQSAQSTGLLSFQNGGFTAGSSSKLNTAGNAYVSYLFKKGVTPGFDIVSYTGTGANRTIAHNLGAEPAFIIIHSTNTPNGIDRPWTVYHQYLGPTKYMLLNTQDPALTISTNWNNTAPTSSVFSLGTENNVNNAAGTVGEYVAYLFAEVPGFSKFGAYTGTASADGPFIYTGFKPAFVLIKNSTTGSLGSWQVRDNMRNASNPAGSLIWADRAQAESTSSSYDLDMLSNGFKIRSGSSSDFNASANVYIYAAFAEQPFKYTKAK